MVIAWLVFVVLNNWTEMNYGVSVGVNFVRNSLNIDFKACDN